PLMPPFQTNRFSNGPVFASRPAPFDLTLCEANFPRLKDFDDSELSQALLKRHQDITPAPSEQMSVQSLVRKVKSALEKLMLKPAILPSALVEEYREVGSYRKDTMLAGHTTADIVVVLRSLPTVEAVSALGQKIIDELKAGDKDVYACVPRNFGCEIAGAKAVVRLLITTIPSNARFLEPDLHLKEELMISHMQALDHIGWFDANANTSTIKMLIRLVKDIRKRYEPFSALNMWMIDLIVHHAVTTTASRQPLPLNLAFRRFFQLLAAGLLLPFSPALPDPCESTRRIHQCLTFEQMDNLCNASQTLLRIICHGGYKHVIGVETCKTGLITDTTYWGDVVVTPLELAYNAEAAESGSEKTKHKDKGKNNESSKKSPVTGKAVTTESDSVSNIT
ncbi:hypothetical protein AB6A40_009407, partial [Gnathostoma spinigerum]